MLLVHEGKYPGFGVRGRKDLLEGLAFDAQRRLDAMTTEDDYREAIRAFLAGRPADWTG